MSILLALKHATAAAHARAELAFPAPQEFADPAIYLDVLSRLHAFYLAWEPAVYASEDVRAVLCDESATRGKLSLLEADLARAGVAAPWADSVAVVDAPELSPLSALGALYVMEGSTLGGRVILGWLPRDGGDVGGLGTAFFAGYRERTGMMWREFCRRMDAYVALRGGEDEIIAGAMACFDAFERVMRAAASTRHPADMRRNA